MREAGALAVEAPELSLRDRIVAEARNWRGTPFLPQADVRGVGVDCVFLILRTFQAAGIVPWDFPDPRPYPRGWAREGVGSRYRDELLRPYFVEQPQGAPRLPGDVLLYLSGRAEAHGAIVTAWPVAIHAYPGEAVTEQPADRNVLGGLTLTSVWRAKALA